MGLAHLGSGAYKDAAEAFLKADIDHIKFIPFMTGEDVARCGALCTLASFQRKDVQERLLHRSVHTHLTWASRNN